MRFPHELGSPGHTAHTMAMMDTHSTCHLDADPSLEPGDRMAFLTGKNQDVLRGKMMEKYGKSMEIYGNLRTFFMFLLGKISGIILEV